MDQMENDTSKYATEAEKLALRGFTEELVPLTRKIFLDQEELGAMVFIGFGLGEKIAFMPVPVGPFMESVKSKDKLSELLKSLGKKIDPLCICLVTEVWMVITDAKTTTESEIKQMIPSQHPDKQECIMISFESENLMKTFMYPIIRQGTRVFLGENNFSEEGGRTEGRFSGMLKDLKKAKNN